MSTINGYYQPPMAMPRPPMPMAPPMPPVGMGPQPMAYRPQTNYGGGLPSASSIPGGRMLVEFNGGGWLDMGANLAHIYNMAKTGITGGKGVNSAFGQLWRAVKGLHGNELFSGIKGVIGGAIPYATNSALFEGALSAIVNGYNLFTGRESLGDFGGNVVGDTMAGFAGGAGAAVGGAIAMAVLPFSGALGLIITGLAGVLGYGLGSNMIRGTGIYNTIVGGVRGALGGR